MRRVVARTLAVGSAILGAGILIVWFVCLAVSDVHARLWPGSWSRIGGTSSGMTLWLVYSHEIDRAQMSPQHHDELTRGGRHFDGRRFGFGFGIGEYPVLGAADPGNKGNPGVGVKDASYVVAVSVPALPAGTFMLALPIAYWARAAARRRRDQRRCAACGYDLRATPDRCPECGTISPHRSDSAAPVSS